MQEPSKAPPTVRLVESCFSALAELPDQTPYNDAEQALFDRLQRTHNPLEWEEQPHDGNIAKSLWCKMRTLEDQRIQNAAILYVLENQKPSAILPPGGFI